MSQLAAPREGLMPGSSGGEELLHAHAALHERLRYCTEQEKRRGVRVFDVDRA